MFDDFIQEEEQKPSEDLNESKPVDKSLLFGNIEFYKIRQTKGCSKGRINDYWRIAYTYDS